MQYDWFSTTCVTFAFPMCKCVCEHREPGRVWTAVRGGDRGASMWPPTADPPSLSPDSATLGERGLHFPQKIENENSRKTHT